MKCTFGCARMCLGPIGAYLVSSMTARGELRLNGQVPSPVLDLTNPEWSPVQLSHQAMANIVMKPASASSARVITNLIQSDGSINADVHTLLMRTLLLGDADLSARFNDRLEQEHIQILRVVDHRMPLESRRGIADDWAKFSALLQGSVFLFSSCEIHRIFEFWHCVWYNRSRQIV